MKNLATIILGALFISSCAWVNENEAGRSVFIIPIEQTTNCQKVGEISAEVRHKVGFVKRSNDKVMEELQILARNEALKLNANTIAATNKALEGKQDYHAFNCPE